ncbi:MAG: hypothetical protein KC416_09850 [Myxococcales bacterium]|nr:hypothetical protein [Myxococcales bacterium]
MDFSKAVWVLGLGCLVGGGLAGCSAGPEGACTAGAEGCECVEGTNGSLCLDGLTCLSGRCVDPNAASEPGSGQDNNMTSPDGGGGQDKPEPNWDAYFADDPPPMQCNEDGSVTTPTDVPGGTPDCPDDKNREGCPCSDIGESAACWPGKRIHRDRGICMDGVTTCERYGEFGGRWGPCENAVLPVQGVEFGPQACRCFSEGRWDIDNLSPCFISYGDGTTWSVSTFQNSSGQAQCPTSPGTKAPPTPEPGKPWSTNRLKVDCEGDFELCYVIRAGDFDNPSASDCIVGKSCTQDWYGTRDAVQELPALGAWAGTDPACAKAFANNGGYGEMTVKGLSVECDDISDNGDAYVFNRVKYCSLSCAQNPGQAGCEQCMTGGSGTF